MLESIHGALENLMRVQGAKVPTRQPRQHIVNIDTTTPNEDEVPLLQDVLNKLTGGATVLSINESELPKWQGR